MHISLRNKLFAMALPLALLATLLLAETVRSYRCARSGFARMHAATGRVVAGHGHQRYRDIALWDTASLLFLDGRGATDLSRIESLSRQALRTWQNHASTASDAATLRDLESNQTELERLSDEIEALVATGQPERARRELIENYVPLHRKHVESHARRLIDLDDNYLTSTVTELAGDGGLSSLLGSTTRDLLVRANEAIAQSVHADGYVTNIANEGAFLVLYVLGGDSHVPEFETYAITAANKLSNWARLVQASDEYVDSRAVLKNLVDRHKQLEALASRIQRLVTSGDRRGARTVLTSAYHSLLQRQLEQADELIRRDERSIDRAASQSEGVARKGSLVLIVIALLLLGLGAAAVTVSSRLARRIERLRRVATQLGQGDVPEALTIGSRDELGALAGAFNTMALNVAVSKERAEHLLDRIVQSSEEERTQVAAELHDGPVQRLTGLLYGLERAHLRLGKQDVAVGKELVEQAKTGLAFEIGSLRRLMSELRPPALDERGLPEALSDYAAEFGTREGIACITSIEVDGRLSQSLETTVYRIVQEALTNVAKHSDAKVVSVTFQAFADGYELVVSDDGVGFDTSQAKPNMGGEHFGLTAIKERARMAGGTTEVTSSVGEGTTLRAWFPAVRAAA